MIELVEHLKDISGELAITALFIYYQIKRDKVYDARLGEMTGQFVEVSNEGHKVAEGLKEALDDLRQEMRSFPNRMATSSPPEKK